ncbi:MAG TPA: thiol-disulfide oxidoreductase DCC family protein [Phenylobacterium sp.]|nr:thiol-disulfide oxidoreductase DCC family protein [Phenylobacterium sp.]
MSDPPDALWLFDGVCNFCSGSVRTILKLDRRGVIRFTPLQSPYGRRLAAEHGLNPDAPSSFVFFDRGRPLEKSTAILALLARLPPPWRWARIVRVLPRRWRDAAYDWLAANRYRLMGRAEACMVPTPEVRARFLLDTPAG